jgi:hypothetical protein
VVLVCILDHLTAGVVSGGDIVHVDIERHHDSVNRNEVEGAETRFLLGFAEGDFFDVPLTIGVAAELQPTVELAMMCQKGAAAIRGNDPGRSRNVARPTRAIEAIGVALDKPADAVDHVTFGGKGRAIMSE